MPDPELKGTIRLLRTLVGTLTIAMIIGIVTITIVIVISFSREGPDLPENITLPDGEQALAITVSEKWIGVVSNGDRFLIYDRHSGLLLQEMRIDALP